MERCSTEIVLANGDDLLRAEHGLLEPGQVRSLSAKAEISRRPFELVLPEAFIAALGLSPDRRATIRRSDGRQEERAAVETVHLACGGRRGLFRAIIDPSRTLPLIGALVLQALELIPDFTTGMLTAGGPDGIFAEFDPAF